MTLENHSSFKSLEHDWLDALSVLVRAGGYQREVRKIYTEISLALGDTKHRIVTTDAAHIIVCSTRYAALYHVERIELLVSAIIHTGWETGIISRYAENNIHRRLGVASLHFISINERWRQIGFELDSRSAARSLSFVARMFEDRPKCGWCPAPLVTGSTSPARADLHAGCYQYVMDVVRPQVIADRKREQDALKVGANTDG